MNTVVGGFLSFSIMTLALGYAASGMIDLIKREDPIINENLVKDYYAMSSGLNLELKQAD